MKKTYGIYIHIPFCRKRCSYCAFYSLRTTLFQDINEVYNQFSIALIKELLLYSSFFKENIFKTIFIGGGTPSILPIKYFEPILETLFNHYQFSPNLEFTIEVNPESVTNENLAFYKNSNVNRISMGCQSFHDPTLIEIGRETSKEEIIKKYFLIRKHGFQNVNLDFIFGLWNQPKLQYQKDLKIAVELNPEHISTYGLTLERKDLKSQHEKKEINIPSEHQFAKDYLFTINYLERYNYFLYEVSNFSKKKKQCKHNLIYWTQKDYIGFGPSAASTIQNKRYKNYNNLKIYFNKLKEDEKPIQSIENLTKKDLKNEKLIFSLRQRKGLDLNSITWDHETDYENFIQKIYFYQNHNFLKIKNNVIKMKKSGLLLLDTILANLIE